MYWIHFQPLRILCALSLQSHVAPEAARFGGFQSEDRKSRKPPLKFLLSMGTYFTRPGTSAGKVFLNSSLIGPTWGLLSWHASSPHRKRC